MHIPGRWASLGQKHPALSLALALAGLWLLLYASLLFGNHVLPWDAIDEFYPTVYFNAHSLRMGLAPWWNPYVYSGYPQIADPQGMLFSPLMMAWMLLRQSPGAHWFTWAVLLHLLVGGLAMLGLMRRSGANGFGALLGAMVFMAGGVAASRLEHVPLVLAYAYAPVALLALRHFLAAPGLARGALFGVAAGAMSTQLVQVAYLFALAIGAYAIAALAWHWPRYATRERRRCAAGLAAACLLASAIALPQLIFSWAYLDLSNRTEVPLAAAATSSLPLRSLYSLLLPNAWHALSGPYTGPADRVAAYFYIGVLPLLLLPGLAPAWRQPAQRRQILFFSASAAVAILYMLGLHTPLYGWLYDWMPGLKHFRRPSDAAYLLNFSVAILAGLAASHFRLDSRRHVGVLLAIATAWLVLASLQLRGTEARWQARSLIAATFAALAWWRLRRPGSTARTAAWLLLLLVADYGCFNLNGSLNRGPDVARYFMRYDAASFLVHAQRTDPGLLPPRIEPVDAHVIWDNYVVLRGLASTQGYNPLRYALYDHWYGARDNGNLPRVDTPYNPSPASTLSDLLGVTYLVRGRSAGPSHGSPPPGYLPVFAGKDVDIWRNTRAYPRVLTPLRAILLQPAAMPAPATFAHTDFRDDTWLTPRDADDARTAGMAAETCTGRLQAISARHSPTRVAIRTRGTAAGWLVLGDLDFPGWQADVDGRPVPIHRANGMFRAVCVPAGEHTVAFTFHPWGMVAAALRRARHT